MSVLSTVIRTLNTYGILASRAFAETKQFDCAEVCAAVGYHQIDEKGTQVVVTIFTPEELGGAICEDAAVNAGLALTALGAKCCQGRCNFDSRSRLFSVELLAAFWVQEEEP